MLTAEKTTTNYHTQKHVPNLTILSAKEIASLVQTKTVSPEEVTKAFLERIKRIDPKFGAFQLIRETKALEEARTLNEHPNLSSLPLAGVPIAIKDNVDVAGEPTRIGTSATASTNAIKDDELVKRLRDAGAIIIGKTKLPEFAIWIFTESNSFGVTKNPWNINRTPGGSSGGSAAAVAAGMVPLALGSDGGGSIRAPAACCGIAGFKPGPGIIPIGGGLKEHWLGLTEFGPFARTSDDLSLMYDVLRGAPQNQTSNKSSKRLKIALSFKHPQLGIRVDNDVKYALENLANQLSQAGHTIVSADPHYPLDFSLRYSMRWLPGISQDTQHCDPNQLEARTRLNARLGRWIQKLGWDKPASVDRFGHRMEAWLDNYDVLLTPTLTKPALPVDTWRSKGSISTGIAIGNWIYTNLWNLARLPAASIPAGLSKDNLPIGAQLIAKRGDEQIILALIAESEKLVPWPKWKEDLNNP